jgi:hypothetical protein
MSAFLIPFSFLVACLSGWLREHQQIAPGQLNSLHSLNVGLQIASHNSAIDLHIFE